MNLGIDEVVAKVYLVQASGQKLVTIPRKAKISAGDYVIIKKL